MTTKIKCPCCDGVYDFEHTEYKLYVFYCPANGTKHNLNIHKRANKTPIQEEKK